MKSLPQIKDNEYSFRKCLYWWLDALLYICTCFLCNLFTSVLVAAPSSVSPLQTFSFDSNFFPRCVCVGTLPRCLPSFHGLHVRGRVWQPGSSFLSLLFISVSYHPSVSSSYVPHLNVTNTHAQRAAISDAPSVSPPLLPPVALLQSHLLRVRPILLAAMVTGRLGRRAGRQGLEEGWRFGFGHFVEKGKISHVFPRRGQGNYGGELVPPEDLVWEVGRSNLAGGWGWLDRGAHDHQQLKVSQVRVCPAPTCRTQDRQSDLIFNLIHNKLKTSFHKLLHSLSIQSNVGKDRRTQTSKHTCTPWNFQNIKLPPFRLIPKMLDLITHTHTQRIHII